MSAFYVILPSTGSSTIFPENTAARFRNQLTAPIDLREGTPRRWRVALTELSYYQPHERIRRGEKVITKDDKISLRLMRLRAHYVFWTTVMFTGHGNAQRFTSGSPLGFEQYHISMRWDDTKERYSIRLLQPDRRLDLTGVTVVETGFGLNTSDIVVITSNDGWREAAHSAKPIWTKGYKEGKTLRWYFVILALSYWYLTATKHVTISLEAGSYPNNHALATYIHQRLEANPDFKGVGAQLTHNEKRKRMEWAMKLPSTDNDKSLVNWLAQDTRKRIVDEGEYWFAVSTPPASLVAPPFNPVEGTILPMVVLTGNLPELLHLQIGPLFAPTVGEKLIDLVHGLQMCYVHTNIIEPVAFGETQKSILRTIIHNHDKKEDVITYTFSRPYYILVAPDILDCIEVALRDEEDALILFEKNQMVLATLHFVLV